MHNFVYTAYPTRVVFGVDAWSTLRDEVALLGARKVFVVSTPGQRALAERALSALGEQGAGIYDQAVMHVPVATVNDARDAADKVGTDCVVAIGGGSTIGLAKAMALECELPILAVPTTYAGSEMTPIYGVTADGKKKTGKDLRVLPRVAVYDPSLSLGLPVDISVASGLNAIAHAAEGLYSRDGNPILALMAEEGIRAMAVGLRQVVQRPDDLEARRNCLYGAWLCGMVLGSAGMALHHKLCHALGGGFNLPHAETHAVLLPHVLAYNADAAPGAMRRIARALGQEGATAASAVYDLAQDLHAPASLRVIGMKASDLDRATHLAMAHPYSNPRPIEAGAIRALLQSAFEGSRPDAKP
jgi:maleylacetate reductase